MQNDMSTAVMWSKSKPDVEFNSNMANVWANSVTCHPRATCHILGCKNSIGHIENRFSPYLIFFKCSLGFDERRLSYRLRYACFIKFGENPPITV